MMTLTEKEIHVHISAAALADIYPTLSCILEFDSSTWFCSLSLAVTILELPSLVEPVLFHTEISQQTIIFLRIWKKEDLFVYF